MCFSLTVCHSSLGQTCSQPINTKPESRSIYTGVCTGLTSFKFTHLKLLQLSCTQALELLWLLIAITRLALPDALKVFYYLPVFVCRRDALYFRTSLATAPLQSALPTLWAILPPTREGGTLPYGTVLPAYTLVP
ncbi:hypothetical protein KIL84_017570 [Mauremys mutica]|uniref:Uncharacterized protein n=1 Tax=Mauremys mutica TaxID=74926 RepID=A0A9D4AYR2_9SAUR|nr:hypothetical protein KIL84_017570 [Mauremys mutica]